MNKRVFFVAISACLFLSNFTFAAEQIDLKYEKKCAGVFKGSIKATGLYPNHKYVMTLNGRTDHDSNKVLIEECEVYKQTGEGFCDFAESYTDKDGALNLSFEESLPKGKYKIKFLIKDPDDDWKVIWSKNVVKFEIIEDSK